MFYFAAAFVYATKVDPILFGIRFSACIASGAGSVSTHATREAARLGRPRHGIQAVVRSWSSPDRDTLRRREKLTADPRKASPGRMGSSVIGTPFAAAMAWITPRTAHRRRHGRKPGMVHDQHRE